MKEIYKRKIQTIKSSEKTQLLIIFIVYLVANIFYLLNNFVYWDDWCMVDLPLSGYREHLYNSGGFWFIHQFIRFFQYHVPPFLERIVTFLLTFVSVVCVYKILNKNSKDKYLAFWVSVFFALFPVVFIRYALIIDSYYYLCCVFSIASYLYINFYSDKKRKWIALFLFFFSFDMNSLLVFYAVPFCYCWYVNFARKADKSENITKTVGSFIKENITFICVPFVYFLIKTVFFHSHGIYAETAYNVIDIHNIFKSPIETVRSVTEIISYITKLNISIKLFVLVICFCLVKDIIEKEYEQILILCFVCASCFFAIAAYVMVGKLAYIPYSDFFLFPKHTRFLQLMALPISLLFYIIIKKIFKYPVFVFVLLSMFMVSDNLNIGYKFYEDELIGKSIIMKMSENEDIRNNVVFEFSSNNFSSGFLEKELGDYPLFGHFYAAFGDEKRIAYNSNFQSEDIIKIWYNVKDRNFYRCSDVESSDLIPTCKIIVNVNDAYVNKKTVLLSVIYRTFSKEKYNNLLCNIVDLKTELF